MRLLTFAGFCVIAFHGEVLTAYLPPYITPCKIFTPNFQKCWKTSLENLGPYVTPGIKELQIPPGEPLIISKLTISKKQSDTAVYNVNLKNITITGVRGFQILGSNLDPDLLVINLKVGFPKLKWSSDGSAEGEILGFSLNGSFGVEIDFKNLVVDLTLDGILNGLYGHKYIDWSQGSTEVTYDSVSFTVRDLYKDEDLMQAFNSAINQNALLLAEDVKGLIENSVGKYIVGILNGIHQTYTQDVLFPKD